MRMLFSIFPERVTVMERKTGAGAGEKEFVKEITPGTRTIPSGT